MWSNGKFIVNAFYGRVHISKKVKTCNRDLKNCLLWVLQKTALDVEMFKSSLSYFEECTSWRIPLKTTYKNIYSSGGFFSLLFCSFWALMQSQMICDEKNNVSPLSSLHKSLHKLKENPRWKRIYKKTLLCCQSRKRYCKIPSCRSSLFLTVIFVKQYIWSVLWSFMLEWTQG